MNTGPYKNCFFTHLYQLLVTDTTIIRHLTPPISLPVNYALSLPAHTVGAMSAKGLIPDYTSCRSDLGLEPLVSLKTPAQWMLASSLLVSSDLRDMLRDTWSVLKRIWASCWELAAPTLVHSPWSLAGSLSLSYSFTTCTVAEVYPGKPFSPVATSHFFSLLQMSVLTSDSWVENHLWLPCLFLIEAAKREMRPGKWR